MLLFFCRAGGLTPAHVFGSSPSVPRRASAIGPYSPSHALRLPVVNSLGTIEDVNVGGGGSGGGGGGDGDDSGGGEDSSSGGLEDAANKDEQVSRKVFDPQYVLHGLVRC